VIIELLRVREEIEEVQCYGCLLHSDLFSVGAHVNVTGSERVLFLVYVFSSDEVNICHGMHASMHVAGSVYWTLMQ
jgi:hypothetical protein